MERGRIPSFHVVAESIPEAFYKAMDVVWHGGMSIRTQYDRVEKGEFIDPPSRDARILIEVKNPFTQPRYSRISFCEIGKYIAEIMGCKDHLVIPYDVLIDGLNKGKIPEHWPYTYHQRLFTYPSSEGVVDQMELMLERLAESPITRRAVATTRVPRIDSFLSEDLPCLGEVQLRCVKDENEKYFLNMDTRWRSRDLYKAWCDNVIALTFLQQILAKKLEQKIGEEVNVGSYADYSTSLHIYGQDFSHIKADPEKGIREFFDKFKDAESFKAGCISSEKMKEILILPQLEDLLKEEEQWRFSEGSKNIINDLIEGLRSGRYLA